MFLSKFTFKEPQKAVKGVHRILGGYSFDMVNSNDTSRTINITPAASKSFHKYNRDKTNASLFKNTSLRSMSNGANTNTRTYERGVFIPHSPLNFVNKR